MVFAGGGAPGHRASLRSSSRANLKLVPLNLLHACSATERVLTWERCQQRVIVRVSGERGGPRRPTRSQGSREQKQTVDLLEEWLHGTGSVSGTGPPPCLGGFESAVFQRLAFVRGIANCRPEV